MVPFAGWEMPVQYSGILDEVRVVREAAGVFDVSHMGEIAVTGPGALAWLNAMTTNDVSRLTPGRAQYSVLCAENGGILDDILIYELDEDRYLVVVNASNTEKDLGWLHRHRAPGAELHDLSDEMALIAVQGPRSAELLAPLVAADLTPLRHFQFVESTVAEVTALVARTGYTGEDGFELFTREDPRPIWEAVMERGQAVGAKPCGLGARDVLRLEAGNVLYGHEITENVNPLVADLGWVVKLGKGPFMGSEAIARVKEAGWEYRLVGLEMESRAVPREGYAIASGSEACGEVTSGTFSPTLGKPIAMGYVAAALAEPGTPVQIRVRERPEPAHIVKLPFYRGRR
jgi:glycine cleavage system T protein (aminomethyltransferase)